MTVKHEIKSQLAKLLATEDLIVEHKQCETACFNVHTRVLTLPMWERASNIVYDLLVGHEVGHALFTPDEDWLKRKKIPPQFVNVVEDARIEKMMKRKYAGLAKTFYHGYKELHEEDFFSLSDSDITNFNLADRANLYFKIGNFLDLSFTEEELAIIRMIDGCDDFEDVLIAAEALYKFCKKKQDEEVNKPTNQTEDQQPASELFDEDAKEEVDGESDDQVEDSQEPISTDQQIDIDTKDEPKVETADSLSGNLKDLINENSSETVYLEVPKVNLDNVIASNNDVHDYIDWWWSRYDEFETPIFAGPDQEFIKFKRNAQKEVNYLVKEFECRKAADSYARASTARTGVLDTSNLHTYKFNEDLFKKVTVLPDGKNHGLVFVLDWSGSMSNVMSDTCKQLFNLVWFCKKVNIPFEVYAFTNEWNRQYVGKDGEVIAANLTPHFERKEGLFAVEHEFSLMNILSSKVSGKEMEKQMLSIWRLAYSFGRSYSTSYAWPERLSLSGTPLNESLVCLHQILPKFQRENKLQKIQCIILTDGEANSLAQYKEITRYWERDCEPYIGHARVDPSKTVLRDRKLGTTYKMGYHYHEFTDVMLRNLKDKFPNVNFIGMRVLVSRDVGNFMRLRSRPGEDEFSRIQKEWKKDKSFCIKNSGYDAYFGLSSNSLAQDAEFDVDEGATKAKIKSAFVKSLKVKKLNKKVLGEFISLVA